MLGGLEHVFPTWFAPQIPVVSASNVDAIAANEALQRYEEKVVCGPVTTTSGRRVFDANHI